MTEQENRIVNENLLQAVANIGLIENCLNSLETVIDTLICGLTEEGVEKQSIDTLQIIRMAVKEIQNVAENGEHEILDMVDCKELIKEYCEENGIENENNEAE
jgi:hypothetical protein